MPLAFILNFVCGIAGAVLAYLGLSVELILLIIVLMLSDIATGVIKVEKDKFNSRRLTGGVYSKFAGLGIVFAFAFFIKATLVALEATPNAVSLIYLIQGSVLAIIAAGEFYSIVRNLIAIGWKVEIPEWNVWIFLIAQLRERVERYFKKD